ncbi:MAG: TonB family protein [Deltaproteobacteria bacterium]|nr:TonB family protein [Deltaproteobacteria bacterium]
MIACFILWIQAKPIKIKKSHIIPAHVVWAPTVKSKQKTPEHKLPPPDVPRTKPEPPKEKAVSLEKKPLPKTPKKEEEEDRKKQLADALAQIKQQIDDRPIPKDDNFASGPEDKAGTLTSEQIASLQSSPAMDIYKNDIQAIIINNFLWYQSDTHWVTKIEIKLASDGRIVDANVLESSGNISFDQATIRAVKKSSPFPPPPATLIPLFKQETIVFAFRGSQL